jgi:hypothetical protein
MPIPSHEIHLTCPMMLLCSFLSHLYTPSGANNPPAFRHQELIFPHTQLANYTHSYIQANLSIFSSLFFFILRESRALSLYLTRTAFQKDWQAIAVAVSCT